MANVLVERQSLVNAADAIREKLGTQELITPEDFGEKIGEISGGGENIPRTQWGAVKIYPELIVNFNILSQSGCTVVVNDAALFLSFCEENNLLNDPFITVQYRSGRWRFGWGGVTVRQADLLATTGLQITRETTSAMAELEYAPSPSGDPIWVNLLSASEYATIKDYESGHITVSGVSVHPPQVLGFAFGTDNVSTNQGMFTRYPNIEKIYFDNADSLVTIADAFCSSCNKIDSPISCDTVTTIGDNVLSSCPAFVSPINLPHASSIGIGFLSGSKMFRSNRDLVLDFSHMTSIPSFFLNGTIITSLSFITTDGTTMYSSITSIGNYVFSGVALDCVRLKSDTVTSIGYGFLQNAILNSATSNILDFPNVTTIGGDFLNGMCSLGSVKLNLPSVTSVGRGFFRNGDFTLGETPSSTEYTLSLPVLTSTDENFMRDFNGHSTITLYMPSLETIYPYFLMSCRSRITSFTIPENAQGYLDCFAYEVDIENVVCNAPYSNFIYVNSSNAQYVLSSSTDRSVPYLLGVQLKGPYREEFLEALPNRDTSPFRQLLDGGEE